MTKGSGRLFVKIIDGLGRGNLTLGLMIRRIDGKFIYRVYFRFYGFAYSASSQQMECLFFP